MPSKKPARKAVKKAPKKPARKPVKKAAPKAASKKVKKAAPKATSKKVKKAAPKATRKKVKKATLKATGKPVKKPATKAAAKPNKMADADAFTISTTPRTKGKVGGRLEMSKKVVAAIANYTARRVEAVHALGKAGLLYRSIGTDPTRGVDAEVGEEQAALDLEVVIEYGCDITETVTELRKMIAQEVYKTANREVVEINIKVTGIHIEE